MDIFNKLRPTKILFVERPELISHSSKYAVDNGYASLFYYEFETYQIKYVTNKDNACVKTIKTNFFDDQMDGDTHKRAEKAYQNLIKKCVKNYKPKGVLIKLIEASAGPDTSTVTITLQDNSIYKETFSKDERKIGHFYHELNLAALKYKETMLSRELVQGLVRQYGN